MATIPAARPQTAPGTGKTPPGPRGHLLLGSLPELQRDRLGFMLDVARRYGDVARFRVATFTLYQLGHPEHIKHVLLDNARNYSKDTVAFNLLRPMLGNGLLTSDGEVWLHQRRLMQPAFHRQRIAAFGATMTAAAGQMLERWQPFAERGEPVDVLGEMMRLTLDIATDCLFSTGVGDQAKAIGRAIDVFVEDIIFRFDRPLYPSQAVPTPRNLRYRAARRLLDQVVYDIIRRRRRSGEERDDLLGLLMAARDEETGAAMDDRQLRDEVITLLIAGHETTANALSWACHLLAQHPLVEERLRDEVAAVLDGRTPTVADLPRLSYTRMVLDETMRLYPPAWVFEWKARADDTFNGFRVPAGATVFISPYVVHRHPAIWEQPETFVPERFAQEGPARPRYAYLPFGGGQRQCIGNGFALVEAQLVLAMLAQRYRLSPADEHPVESEPLLMLRPRGGLRMIPRSV